MTDELIKLDLELLDKSNKELFNKIFTAWVDQVERAFINIPSVKEHSE